MAIQMTPQRVAAIVASAVNLIAAQPGNDWLRKQYPSGMRPANAEQLPKSVRVGWLESYIDGYINNITASERNTLLYSARDAQAAIDFLNGAAQ